MIECNNTLLCSAFQISLIWPVIYLIFWAFLLIFSLYSEPVVCGIGLAIMLTGVPVYFLGVYWENKPQCFDVFISKSTAQCFMFILVSSAEKADAPLMSNREGSSNAALHLEF